MELVIGVGVSLLIFGLIVASIQWFRYSMVLISSVDQDAQLLRLPRILNQELFNAREVVIPSRKSSPGEAKPSNHLVFRDSTGDVSMVFLDPQDRLIQYSHSRSQFRDLVAGIIDFQVWHSSENYWEYQLVRKTKKGEEAVFGSFQIQGNKL